MKGSEYHWILTGVNKRIVTLFEEYEISEDIRVGKLRTRTTLEEPFNQGRAWVFFSYSTLSGCEGD